MSNLIDLDRFRAVVDAYGAQPPRWPDDVRPAMLALADASPEARALLAEARRLDVRLDHWRAPPAPAALRERLIARAPRRQRSLGAALRELWSDLGGLRLAGPALAAALVMGVGFGIGVAPQPLASDEDTVYALAGLDATPDADDDWMPLR